MPAKRILIGTHAAFEMLERLEREKVVLDRALETLDHGPAPEARQLMATPAAGEPGAWLTQQAKTALNRLDGSVSNRG